MNCPICNKEMEIIACEDIFDRTFREHYCESCKEKFLSIDFKIQRKGSIPKKPIIDDPKTPWEIYLARGY